MVLSTAGANPTCVRRPACEGHATGKTGMTGGVPNGIS